MNRFLKVTQNFPLKNNNNEDAFLDRFSINVYNEVIDQETLLYKICFILNSHFREKNQCFLQGKKKLFGLKILRS